MSKTVAEIIEEAEFLSEESYETAEWVGLINDCMDDLTPVAKMLEQTAVASINVSDGVALLPIAGVSANADIAKAHEFLAVYFTPTTPARRITQYRKIPMNNNVSEGWKRTGSQIKVVNIPQVGGVDVSEGTVTVDYYKKLAHVDLIVGGENDGNPDTSYSPELPGEYHNLIVLYLCAKSQQKEEELNDKNDFFGEYILGKNAMALDRIWEMEPENQDTIRAQRTASKLGIREG